MHNKFRNSMIALSAVLAFVVGGAFFSEPLRTEQVASETPARTLSPEARFALALLNATVSVASASAELDEAEAQAAEAAAIDPGASQPVSTRRHHNKRPALGMPYFSFASFLPRTPQES